MNAKKTKSIEIDPSKLPAGQIRIKKKPAPDTPQTSSGESTSHQKPGGSEDEQSASQPKQDGHPGRQEKGEKEQFKFLCNSCGMKLQAPQSSAKDTVLCPNCKNQITVPQPTSGTNKEGLNYQRPAVFKFFCVRCGKSLEIDRSLSGRAVECPFCHSTIAVPDPPDQPPEPEKTS